MPGHPVFRNLHDLGLATWAGGSLMGAIGLNGAAAAVSDPTERFRASTAGWSRWAPVNAAALGAHLAGASGLLVTDWPRVRSQEGVLRSSAIKTVVTAAGVGLAGWSFALNRKMAHSAPVPVAGATEPSAGTPADIAKTQRQLKLVQWLNPVVTFSLIAITDWQSEQQRPVQEVQGVLKRLGGGSTLPFAGAGVLAALSTALLARRRRRATSSQDQVVDLVAVDVVEVDAIPMGGTQSTMPSTSTPSTSTTSGTTTSGTPSGNLPSSGTHGGTTSGSTI